MKFAFWKDDDGCSGTHHFGDGRELADFKLGHMKAFGVTEDDEVVSIGPRDMEENVDCVDVFKIKRKVVYKCEHEGCHERKEKWEHVGYMPRDKLENLDSMREACLKEAEAIREDNG